MQGCNCGLNLIRTRRSSSHCLFNKRESFGNLGLVPKRAVLFFKGDQLTLANAGGAAGIVQQHQGQQRYVLRFAWHQVAQYAAQPDGFGAEIGAHELVAGGGDVAFVKDQIDHGLHRGEALGEAFGRRNFVGNVGFLNLAFGAYQALRERRFGKEKGFGDFRCAESA